MNKIILAIQRKNNRATKDTLYEDIEKMWNAPNVKYRDFAGVPSDSLTHIYNAYKMVSCAFQQDYGVRSHTLQISLPSSIFDEIEAWNFLEELLEYFASTYQTLLTMNEANGYYHGRFLLNSTSYVNGYKFWDNNAQYTQLCKLIYEKTGLEVMLNPNVLFSPYEDAMINFK